MGEEIGFLWSVIWIVGSFMVGMGLLKNAHLSIMSNMRAVAEGKLNKKTLVKNLNIWLNLVRFQVLLLVIKKATTNNNTFVFR